MNFSRFSKYNNIKNIKVIYQSELRFLGMHIRQPKIGHPYSFIKSKAIYMMKALKETMSTYMIRNIYYSNSELCIRYGILWCEDNDDNIFNWQEGPS
jgi:hypothetical protein